MQPTTTSDRSFLGSDIILPLDLGRFWETTLPFWVSIQRTSHAVKKNHTKFDQGRYIVHPIDMLLWTYKVAKEFRSLQELILFCAEDGTEFVAGVEKQLDGMWKREDGDSRSFGFLVSWKMPKITLIVYEADYSSLQTRAKVQNERTLGHERLTHWIQVPLTWARHAGVKQIFPWIVQSTWKDKEETCPLRIRCMLS